MTAIDKTVVEFKLHYPVSRAIYWDGRCEKFWPRAYSATVIAQKANEALAEFRLGLAAAVVQ